MSEINIERSHRTGKWIRGYVNSGCCFTISPDRLEEILRTGALPKAFQWKLKPTERVERLVMNETGITVYIANAKD